MKILSSEEFQQLHTRLSHLGQQLQHYAQELRSGQLKEGNPTSGLEQIEQNLAKALDVLDRQTYEVAVIAAMKAGKSTFLNAVIGAEVLASESESCTVCRTEIRHLNPGATPYLLEYKTTQAEPILIAEGSSQIIGQEFLKRTHEIRQTNTVEETDYFELYHPIVAIQDHRVLSGFTLIDTPGPNEWETKEFNAVSLKQTALQVMRSCQVILFILDYTSFRDSTNQDLLRELLEQREHFLEKDQDKLYFLLNKVDLRGNADRPLEVVISDLKKSLKSFGIPNPKIFATSARKGLLARLIDQLKASENHLQDFKNFFLARYAKENEDGDLIMPGPKKVAPQALQDSNIPEIEESIISTIAQNAGLNLLRDVLGQTTIAASEIETLLQVEIQGWSIAVEDLEQRLGEYTAMADRSQNRLQDIEKKIVVQQDELTQKFNQELDDFADRAIGKIKQEIDLLIEQLKSQKQPGLLSLAIANLFSVLSKGSLDGYVISFASEFEASKAYDQINKSCTPIIQTFWLDTQDKLSREGNIRRNQVAREIEQEVQVLADELTALLGKALEFEFKPTPITIPNYDFPGIDKMVERRRKDSKHTEDRCCSSPHSYVITTISYVIDFREVIRAFEKTIRIQKLIIKELIKQVISEQINTDLNTAKTQFKSSFQRVEQEIQYIIQKRSDQSVEAEQAIETLHTNLAIIQEYQKEIDRINAELSLN